MIKSRRWDYLIISLISLGIAISVLVFLVKQII